MLQAFKKLLGADEDSKAARLKAAEEERLEREKRLLGQKEALKAGLEAKKDRD